MLLALGMFSVLITVLTVVDFVKTLQSPTKVVKTFEGYVEVAV